MTARLDVPALLREAGRRSSPPDLTEEEAAFLIRLADAVEAYRTAWDRRLSATAHAELMVEMHRRADAVLALLRGEDTP